MNIIDAKVNVTIAIGIFIYPTSNLTKLSSLESEHVIYFVQEQMPLSFKHFISIILLASKKHQIHFRIFSPTSAANIKATGEVTVSTRIISNFDSSLNGSFVTIFVDTYLSNFFSLDVETKLLIKCLTEAFYNTTTVIFEVTAYCHESSRHSYIPHAKNII